VAIIAISAHVIRGWMRRTGSSTLDRTSRAHLPRAFRPIWAQDPVASGGIELTVEAADSTRRIRRSSVDPGSALVPSIWWAEFMSGR
jgi:hypothetical protein